jgi:hypothetical protein
MKTQQISAVHAVAYGWKAVKFHVWCWIWKVILISLIQSHFPVTNLSTSNRKVQLYLGIWASGSVGPLIRNLGVSWRLVVSFAYRPLYRRERFSGIHWLGESLDSVWILGRRKNLSSLPGSNRDPSVAQPLSVSCKRESKLRRDMTFLLNSS